MRHIPALLILFNFKLDVSQPLAQSSVTLFEQGNDTEHRLGLYIKEVDGEKYIFATAQTETGEVQVQIEAPIQSGWYNAGIRIRDNKLELGLDDQFNAVSMPSILVENGMGASIKIGRDFVGHMANLRVGLEDETTALVTLADGSLSKDVKLDSSGKATIAIKASGKSSGGMRRVGFSGSFSTQTARVKVDTFKVSSQFIERVMPWLPTKKAQAMLIEKEWRKDIQPNGIAIVDEDIFGWATEFVLKTLLTDDVVDKLKAVMSFLYEMTGVADIEVLVENIILMIQGRFDEVNKLDVVFAGIGLTLSIVAVITSPTGAGTGAALALKSSLTGLKAFLKNIFKEFVTDGPVMLLKAGSSVARWSFDLMINALKGNGAAKTQLADLGELLTDMLKVSGRSTLLLFMAIVRSPEAVTNFLNMRKLQLVGNCSVGITSNNTNSRYANNYIRRVFTPWRVVGLTNTANASDGVCDLTTYLQVFSSIKNSGRYSDEVINQLNDVGKILNDYPALNLSPQSVEILADSFAKGHYQSISTFLRNAGDSEVVLGRFDAEGLAKFIYKWDPTDPDMSVLDRMIVSFGNLPPKGTSGAEQMMHPLTYRTNKGIVGVIGELEALKTAPEYLNANHYALKNLTDESQKLNVSSIKELDDKVPWDGTSSTGLKAKTVMGIDNIMENTTGIRFYIESKAWASLTDDLYKKLLKQFYKHADTKLLGANPIRKKDFVEADGLEFEFENGHVPNLHYELRGSAFTTKCGNHCDFKEQLIKICKSGGGVFAKLLAAGFKCEGEAGQSGNLTFNIIEENIHPIVN